MTAIRVHGSCSDQIAELASATFYLIDDRWSWPSPVAAENRLMRKQAGSEAGLPANQLPMHRPFAILAALNERGVDRPWSNKYSTDSRWGSQKVRRRAGRAKIRACGGGQLLGKSRRTSAIRQRFRHQDYHWTETF